jgi:branched-chain amino acid transport system substrate-binding protein
MGTYAAKNLGCKTTAIGYTDFPPGQDSALAFKTAYEKAGGKVIDQVKMGNPAQVPDFTPFFQRVKDDHPNCFYVFVPSGAHAAGVMKTYGALNMRKAGIKLIGPMDLIPDYELAHMSDAAVGLVVMGSYADDYDNPANKAFVKAWHQAYGPDSYPDFMSAAGWDTMAAIFHLVKTMHGNFDDDAKVVKSLEGWTYNGPRGPIEIDPKTRDIIVNEHAEEVYKKPDGKLGVKVIATFPRVKDECKELKVGRCAKPSPQPQG